MNREFVNVSPQVDGEDERAWVKVLGCDVRYITFLDSRRDMVLWWPYWCPNCAVNNHEHVGIRHAFEYFVKTAEGKYEAWCELCARYFEFAPRPPIKLCLWLFTD